MVSVREAMLQAGPPWLWETQASALTHSTLHGPRSRLRCKLRSYGCLCKYPWFSGHWSCSIIRLSSLPFKIKPRTLVLKVSQWQQWGKTNNTYEVFNPLILPKLTPELASVGRDSLHPLSPAAYSNTKN